MKRNSIFSQDPDPKVIAAACRILKTGGLVVFPTSMLYGLAADALDSKAIGRIYRAKKRDTQKPILILIKDESVLGRIVKAVPDTARKMMAAFWPGNLTIILEARSVLPDILTGGTGKIGIRVPRHPVAAALVRAFDGPITGTSANLSGEKGCASVSELVPGLADRLDMILDAGPLGGGTGSTVVDATVSPPVVLREGAVSNAQLFAAIGTSP